jgi:hypothetical protein
MNQLILLILLLLSTTLFVILSIKIWKKTTSISFVLGQFFLFYWGLAGSWIFLFDSLSNFNGSSMGLHYYYFFDIMFDVALDGSFIKATLLHSIFILTTQLSLLFSFKSKPTDFNIEQPIEVSAKKIIIFCLSFLALSIFLIKNEISYAYNFNKILYTTVELSDNKLFTIHQVALQVSITLFIFYLTLLKSEKAKRIKLIQDFKYQKLVSITLTVLFISTLAILGNKKELLFSGVIGILFFIDNNKLDKKSIKELSILSLLIIVPLLATDIIRSIRLHSLIHIDYVKEKSKNVEAQPDILQKSDVVQNLGLVAFSNELFFANFSMYGAIKKEIPVNRGISLKYIASSFIPKIIIEDRPLDVYTYYVNNAKKDKDIQQGFTIHHATGWLLNFGELGVLIGGVLLGFIWGKLSSLSIHNNQSKIKKVFVYLTPAITCAFLPILIRNGLEAYKGFLVEALIINCFLIFLTLKNKPSILD